MHDKRTPQTPCWIWSRTLNTAGYGAVFQDGGPVPAHRFVYEALMGPIPDGLELDHLCFTPACVNPDHLEPVTHVENMRRRRWNRLSMESARQIRADHARGVRMQLLAQEHGVNVETIRLVVRNKTWREAA